MKTLRRHSRSSVRCPLRGSFRTSTHGPLMSPTDPSRTWIASARPDGCLLVGKSKEHCNKSGKELLANTSMEMFVRTLSPAGSLPRLCGVALFKGTEFFVDAVYIQHRLGDFTPGSVDAIFLNYRARSVTVFAKCVLLVLSAT